MSCSLHSVRKLQKELDTLWIELKTCITEKENLNGKLKMVLNKLDFTNFSIKCMNKGSMTLDEILKSQKSDSSKAGIGYRHEASTSKSSGNSVLVQSPTLHKSTLLYANTVHANTVNRKSVPKPSFVPICHFHGIKRHI